MEDNIRGQMVQGDIKILKKTMEGDAGRKRLERNKTISPVLRAGTRCSPGIFQSAKL
jgi:hypothetical protein